MTDRPASPDAHLGLVDSIAAWLFPSLYPNLPETGPLVIGPCDRAVELEPEAGG